MPKREKNPKFELQSLYYVVVTHTQIKGWLWWKREIKTTYYRMNNRWYDTNSHEEAVGIQQTALDIFYEGYKTR